MFELKLSNLFSKKIKTKKELINKLIKMQNKYEINYINFLLALYPLIIENKFQKTDLNFISQILFKAFKSKPIEFNNDWKNCKTPTINQVMSFNENNIEAEINLLLQTIQFHLAEFKSMQGKQLEIPDKYFGVYSDQNNRWSNFGILAVFSCGLRGISDNGLNNNSFSWINLAQILEMGRIYE